MAEIRPEPITVSGTSIAADRTNDVSQMSQSDIQMSDQNRSNNKNNNTREGQLHMTDMEALVNLIKGSLGSGFLAMPFAFSHSGLLLGVFGMFFVAVICTHCTYVMVKCSQRLCRLENKDAMSYTDTVEAAYRVGAGGRFRNWVPTMRFICDFFIFFTYFGVTTTYVIFVATTLKQVLETNLGYSLNTRWYVALLTLVVLPAGLVRHLKLLVPSSALANVLLLVGCVLTLLFCFEDMPSVYSRPLVVPASNWPLFFCTALFSMEGIGVIMPIENAMKNPSHIEWVLNVAMGIVAIVYLCMGCIGYIKYGDSVQGSITLNLPHNLLSDSVKIAVAVSILLSYPLQLTAPADVVWHITRQHLKKEHHTVGQYCARSLLVLATVCTAAIVPVLGSVIALVGSIGFSGLGILVPVLTEIVTFWDSLSPGLLAKHLILLLVWATASISGTITSIKGMSL